MNKAYLKLGKIEITSLGVIHVGVYRQTQCISLS